MAPGRVDHIPAFRIALGIAVPLAILLAIGRSEWAMYASFGAFTSIYSRYEPTRMRVRRQLFMAGMLTTWIAIGSLIAHASVHLDSAPAVVLRVVPTAVIAGASAVAITVHRLRPSGPLFPLFAVSAVAWAPPLATVGVTVLVAGASAAWCVLLGLVWHFLGEAHPDADLPEAPIGMSHRQLWGEFGRYTAAALLAGAVGVASGMQAPYWAQLAAVVPLSARRRGAQIERAVHRIVGTVLGVVAAAFLLSFPSQAWQLAVWVVVLQFCAEMFVLRNYALALMFVTPMALLMVQMSHAQPVGPLLRARIGETALGVAVGLGVVVASELWGRWRRQR